MPADTDQPSEHRLICIWVRIATWSSIGEGPDLAGCGGKLRAGIRLLNAVAPEPAGPLTSELNVILSTSHILS